MSINPSREEGGGGSTHTRGTGHRPRIFNESSLENRRPSGRRYIYPPITDADQAQFAMFSFGGYAESPIHPSISLVCGKGSSFRSAFGQAGYTPHPKTPLSTLPVQISTPNLKSGHSKSILGRIYIKRHAPDPHIRLGSGPRNR